MYRAVLEGKMEGAPARRRNQRIPFTDYGICVHSVPSSLSVESARQTDRRTGRRSKVNGKGHVKEEEKKVPRLSLRLEYMYL